MAIRRTHVVGCVENRRLSPSRALAGEHPGAVPATEVLGSADALLDADVRQLIDLAEEGERLAPYVATLHLTAEARGLRAGHQRFAIRNFGVLSGAMMRTTLVAIYVAMVAGVPVYLHGWGGIGRTGTVVDCLLREQGLAVDGRWP